MSNLPMHASSIKVDVSESEADADVMIVDDKSNVLPVSAQPSPIVIAPQSRRRTVGSDHSQSSIPSTTAQPSTSKPNLTMNEFFNNFFPGACGDGSNPAVLSVMQNTQNQLNQNQVNVQAQRTNNEYRATPSPAIQPPPATESPDPAAIDALIKQFDAFSSNSASKRNARFCKVPWELFQIVRQSLQLLELSVPPSTQRLLSRLVGVLGPIRALKKKGKDASQDSSDEAPRKRKRDASASSKERSSNVKKKTKTKKSEKKAKKTAKRKEASDSSSSSDDSDKSEGLSQKFSFLNNYFCCG